MIERRPAAIGVPVAICVVSAILYVALGQSVSHAPPRGIDAAARAVVGEGPRIAWMLTASCLWPVLTGFGLAGLLVAIVAPAWRARVVFAILTTIVSWQVSNVLKDIFMRPRPAYWIVHRETTYAYSSGHALFAVVVYGLWAFFVARSDLPAAVRFVLSPLLGLWGAGVIWSRLALGAHYPSDLAGGVLLAVCMLTAATAVARSIAPGTRIT